MNLELNRINAINSNKKENNIIKNKKINFIDDIINLDRIQSLLIKENYENLNIKTKNNIMNNGYESINDNKDYVECINNNCSKIDNIDKDLVKNNSNNSNSINSNNSNNSNSNTGNNIIKYLDIVISLIYIFLLVIFLLGTVIKREVDNLINILIITLMYLFYKIYIGYKN